MVTSQRPRTGERHVTPLESTRRGAHRARPGALAAALPMLAVIAVVVIAVFALFQIFDSGGSAADPGQAVKDSPQASAGPQASAQPQSSADPQASPSPSSPGDNPGAVDKQAQLIVLNNTATKGLASKAANKLKGADWTVKTIDNLTPRNQVTQTTVFYADSDQEATAQAVLDSLGVGQISQSAHMAEKGITVVLAGDFSS
jgi:hypothetical protein